MVTGDPWCAACNRWVEPFHVHARPTFEYPSTSEPTLADIAKKLDRIIALLEKR